MAIIAVACEKGGAAKTTTAMLMARDIARRGQTAVVLDADISGGATTWAQTAEENGEKLPFPVISVNLPQLKRPRIQTMAGKETWVFIDTPPSDTGVLQAAINTADLTIVPTQTGDADLVLALETYAAAPSALLLLTRVKQRTNSAKQAMRRLAEENIGRFDAVVPEREAIRRLYGTDGYDKLDYPMVVQELMDFMEQEEPRW